MEDKLQEIIKNSVSKPREVKIQEFMKWTHTHLLKAHSDIRADYITDRKVHITLMNNQQFTTSTILWICQKVDELNISMFFEAVGSKPIIEIIDFSYDNTL